MFGTMKAGGLEVPITEVRLVAGGIEFSGEARSTWRRPIRGSGGPVQVTLYGSDGQQIAAGTSWLAEVPEIERGGTYRLTLTLHLEPDRGTETWAAIHRLAKELLPPQQAITALTPHHPSNPNG